MVTTVEFTKMFQALSYGVNAQRQLATMSESFIDMTTPIYVMLDDAKQIAWLKIQGLKKGVNTDASGWLYVSLDLDGADVRVRVYKDAGLANLVLTATGTLATIQDIDFTEANASGLSGSVRAKRTADDADIWLVPRYNVPGLASNFDTATDVGNDDLSEDYATFMSDLETLSREIGNDLLSHSISMRDNYINNFFTTIAAELISSGNQQSGRLLDATPTTTNGALTWKYEGIIKDLYDQMVDDADHIQANTVSAGSATAGSGNGGKLTVTTKTPMQYCYDDDKVWIKCVSALGASLLERFEISSEQAGVDTYQATFRQTFESRLIGLTLFLNRTIALGGAGAPGAPNGIYTPTIVGENTSNVDVSAKALYGDYIQSGTTRRLIIYNGSGKAAADIVADSGVVDIGGAEPTTITAIGSGTTPLTSFAATSGGGLGDGTFAVTIDLALPDVGDYWSFDLVNDLAGVASFVLGRAFLFEFYTNAAPTISDVDMRIWDDTLRGDWSQL